MSVLHVIQQQGQWLSFDGQHLSRSDTRPRLQRAAVVISEFEGSVSNVISLEGSPAHAVALIEKRLRSDGLIDSDSKILIHKTRHVGAGYQTLFTAVPLELWQQTYAWAEAQPDHCLLIPFTSLLWKAIKPGHGLVLQAGRQISVVAMLKHDMLYRTALAYSDHPDDLAMTVGALAEQFADDLANGEDSLEPLSMQWCPVLVPRPAEGQPWTDDTLREIFSARSGVQITTVPLRQVIDENGEAYRSGIGWIQSVSSASISVNPGSSRAAWLAEWALPVASAASLVFALTLGALGARWAMSASEANTRSAQLNSEISDIQDRIHALRAQETVAADYPSTLAFVERATRLQTGADPASSLSLVRDASAGEVRILRVKLEPPEAPAPTRGAPAQAQQAQKAEGYTLRVDGVVDAHRGTPGMQIANFVERLRRAGFDPQPIDPGSGGAGARTSSGFFSYLLKSPSPAQPEARP